MFIAIVLIIGAILTALAITYSTAAYIIATACGTLAALMFLGVINTLVELDKDEKRRQ